MENVATIILVGILLVEIVLCFVMIQMVSKVETTNRLAVSSLIDQNQRLAGHLQEVQMELLNLNHELNLLAIENKKLNLEVSALSSEVHRLQQQITNIQYDELPNDAN